jgi:hypothetical protein
VGWPKVGGLRKYAENLKVHTSFVPTSVLNLLPINGAVWRAAWAGALTPDWSVPLHLALIDGK